MAEGDNPTRSANSTLETRPSSCSSCNILSSNLSMILFCCAFSVLFAHINTKLRQGAINIFASDINREHRYGLHLIWAAVGVCFCFYFFAGP
ncbi:Uncharacterised protein [Vibrio cholerae]|nr:Uncharacterised protein [Vibrio cholerae]